MKALWIALGIVGTIPLVAAAQYPTQNSSPTRSVIKPVGYHSYMKTGCGCNEPAPGCAAAPGCCTPVPPPSIGNCCPKPCLLERLRRGLRSLDCLLPCGLGCHSINCHSSCGGSGGCSSCSASCETKSSCGSCCTKSRAHFFAFCKPKCSSPCGVSCSTPCQVGCCQGIPAGTFGPPMPPPAEDNPFKDDMRPMDPNAPPPGTNTYRPYFKKNNATANSGPQLQPMPAKLDPYAVAPPVHIKARPVQAPVPAKTPAPAPGKYASRLPSASSYPNVTVAVNQEVETVSLTIADDEPPVPPMALPISTAKRIETQRVDRSIPANPLR